MSTITIRQVPVEEMLSIARLIRAYSFSSTPPLPSQEDSLKRVPYEYDYVHLVLYEDDRPVSCVSSQPMVQQVRGKFYSCSGVRGVATHPVARRKGYSHQLLAKLFSIMCDSGNSFSTLYPFRESFYERLGYISFPQPLIAHLEISDLQHLLKRKLTGSVDLFSIADGYQAYWAYLSNLQHNRHGMALAIEKHASFMRDENCFWLACAKDDRGLTCGMMTYCIKKYLGGMVVTDFNYVNSLGRCLLLQWLARHIDQIKEIEITLAPNEHPENWFSDLNITFKNAVKMTPMGRIILLSEISGMQTGPGCFSAQIIDEQCPWNNNCYQFETTNGTLKIDQTSEAECELSIQALSALVYGTNDPDDFFMRGWGNPSQRLQETMRTMFPPLLPYLYEIF